METENILSKTIFIGKCPPIDTQKYNDNLFITFYNFSNNDADNASFSDPMDWEKIELNPEYRNVFDNSKNTFTKNFKDLFASLLDRMQTIKEQDKGDEEKWLFGFLIPHITYEKIKPDIRLIIDENTQYKFARIYNERIEL